MRKALGAHDLFVAAPLHRNVQRVRAFLPYDRPGGLVLADLAPVHSIGEDKLALLALARRAMCDVRVPEAADACFLHCQSVLCEYGVRDVICAVTDPEEGKDFDRVTHSFDRDAKSRPDVLCNTRPRINLVAQLLARKQKRQKLQKVHVTRHDHFIHCRRDGGKVMDVLHDAWSDCACVDVRPVWFVGFEICLFKTSQG